MTGAEIQDMYRLLAIAKYDERYVIPPAHAEQAHSLEELATECSLDYEGGPGMGGSGPFGEGSGAPTPIAVENFQMLQSRQTSDTVAEVGSRRGRVNLLNWDGRGVPDGLFPPPDEAPSTPPRTRREIAGERPPAPGPGRPRAAAGVAEHVPAAGLSRRGAPGAGPPPGGGRRSAARVRGGSARRLPPPPEVDPAARAGNGVRRDLRPPATLLPLPHLRPARRHPAARRRAAAVQDGLPGRRHASSPTRSCRTTSRSSWSSAPPWTPASAWQLLLDHRAGVELLRLALTDAGSPWSHVAQAVCATLPPLHGDDRDAVLRLAAEGPPGEEVGLAPFAPPEYMPEPRRPVPLPMPTSSTASRGAGS